MPSAVPRPAPSAWAAGRRRAGRLALAASLVIVAGFSLGYAAIVSGIGEERLRIEAQSAFAALAGDDFATRIGGVQVSFDGLRMLALDVTDVRIAKAGSDAEIARVGAARFDLRFLPLAGGEVKLGGLRLSDVRFDLAHYPAGGGDFPFLDEAGRIDSDAAIEAVFDAARRLFATLDGRDVDTIELDNIEIALPLAIEGGRVLRVANATLERESPRLLSLGGQMELGDRVATLTGAAALAEGDDLVETLSFKLAAPAPPAPASATDIGVGALQVELTGAQAAGAADRIKLAATVGDVKAIVMRERDEVRLSAELSATLEKGAGKIEIDRLSLKSGRSDWNFHGAIGPAPAADGKPAEPFYRFEFVSDGSTVAAQDLSEQGVLVGVRLAGLIDPHAQVLTFDEVGVRSEDGEVSGNASIRFKPGGNPGIALNLDVADMPVAQVKQLWPWFAARKARAWAGANVYGGRVPEGNVRLDVAPGRLGDGVPLSAEEVSGRFVVRGTRFDIAGSLPPVRDGDGEIVFRGNDVDVTLDSGSVFMSRERSVAASRGTLAIRDAHLDPVVGRLRIDVAGSADSLMQLARYEPIDVGRFIDLAPDDLSGKVKGVVAADIPFVRGAALDKLDWRVELGYEGLALAKPFQGQTISGATGSIVLDPAKATINASATINGMPAKVALVEPFGRGDPAVRQRRVVMQMDDKARRAIAPGLDPLLAGTTDVELDEGGRAGRAVKAKLDRATLTIPWVGWSKGNGVPADVSFAIAAKGDRIDLSDFRLNGDTFGATGALSLVGGELASARFPSARLNRSDDFSLDVKSEGKRYTVKVRGKSIDARSVIKLYGKGDGAGGSGTGGASVKLDLAVDQMTGFHGEVLRGVKLVYSGTGARTDTLQFSATTASGKPVSLKDSRADGERAIVIRSGDAGAVLRFLNVYERMHGGEIVLSLKGARGQPLQGSVTASDFWLVDEPRLRSIVSAPTTEDGRSLNQALRGSMDTQRVHFERGFSRIVKDENFLSLDRGILRGPMIGASFQGVLYDQKDNMAMTGTFMPAYGLNRLFGEIPIIGRILGNGRDRGLIGITFKLAGKAAEPQLQVNPLSVIAPGIFRSVFEYR